MKQGIISRDQVRGLIDTLKKGNEVYGAVKEGSITTLTKITDSEKMELDYTNLKMSLKRLFIPQSEVIAIREEGGIRSVPISEEGIVAFGTRPCDARALLDLDKIFDNEIKDTFYLTRRKNTVIISLACRDPSDTCFCTSLGGSPSGTEGSDILVFDLDESMLFESVTEKGKDLMEANSAVFQPVKRADSKMRDDLMAAAEERVTAIEVNGISGKLEGMFDSILWDEIHRTCLGCGVCTYLCPTCHCFAFYDEQSDSIGKRIKCWDCCQYPTFTLEASGHNPRVSSRERMRQRIMHKFSYFVENFGEKACVGCGRCVANCPVNLDLREIVTKIREESR